MIGQRYCPFCRVPAIQACSHLALAFEARDFVRGCVQSSAAEKAWRTLCALRLTQRRRSGEWSPEAEDFTWLETAFCEEFLKPLRWFGAMDYEWRTGPKPGEGGFWVLLWTKSPQRLWWELRDAFERQIQQLQEIELKPREQIPRATNGTAAPGLTFR
jgi:hypothetical protein